MELSKRIIAGIIILSALCVLVITFLGRVMSLDTSVFLAINSVSNPVLNTLFVLITYIGSSVFWVLAIVMFWLDRKKKVSFYLILTFIVDSISLLFLKLAFFRPRPYTVLPAKVLGFNVFLGSSFPSGHTERAFSGAVILGSFYKKFRIPLYALAILVGISRIYIGVHYPLDTIIGAACGLIFGMIVTRIPFSYAKKLKRH